MRGQPGWGPSVGSRLLPAAVAHADWSKAAHKRCLAIATLQGDGRYLADGPLAVGTAGSLVEKMGLSDVEDGPFLLGFDFPIGIPKAYATLARIQSFRAALAEFGQGVWSDFFEVAVEPDEISVHRPFFPRSCPTRGLRTQEQLTSKLGLSWVELYRRCERATPERRQACPLFWTLGGNQVGKGALSGWRELLQPAIYHAAPPIMLWPFDGNVDDLMGSGRVVVVETYPAEFYSRLGVRFDYVREGGKRSPTARRHNGAALIGWAEGHRISLMPRLRKALEDGFGPSGDGEDAFDAVIGLFGMLNVVVAGRLPDEPRDEAIRSVEGWIFGQAVLQNAELPDGAAPGENRAD